jgi:hypothetical protein
MCRSALLHRDPGRTTVSCCLRGSLASRHYSLKTQPAPEWRPTGRISQEFYSASGGWRAVDGAISQTRSNETGGFCEDLGVFASFQARHTSGQESSWESPPARLRHSVVDPPHVSGLRYPCRSVAPWAADPRTADGFAALAARSDMRGKCYQLESSGCSPHAGDDRGAFASRTMIVQRESAR